MIPVDTDTSFLRCNVSCSLDKKIIESPSQRRGGVDRESRGQSNTIQSERRSLHVFPTVCFEAFPFHHPNALASRLKQVRPTFHATVDMVWATRVRPYHGGDSSLRESLATLVQPLPVCPRVAAVCGPPKMACLSSHRFQRCSI